MAVRARFENSADVGVFLRLTNTYCLAAYGGSEVRPRAQRTWFLRCFSAHWLTLSRPTSSDWFTLSLSLAMHSTFALSSTTWLGTSP
jgi:hypothetical protein